MAALDILQTVTPTPVGGTTSMTITFSALNPGDIVLFFAVASSNASTVTPPSGVTPYGPTDGSAASLRSFAKVVQAGDPLSWTFTSSVAGRQMWVAYRVEGPFTDLSTLQYSQRQGSGAFTTFRVPATDVSVNANTRVFAAVSRSASDAVTFSNGFSAAGSSAFVESVFAATRLYTAPATDVHTEATWGTSAAANGVLFRLQAPAAPPPTATIIIEEDMSSKPIAQNATSVSVEVDAFTLADGTAATSVTHATSGLTVQYWKGERGAVTSVTPVTQTSTGAHTPGGFVHKAAGRYRIDLPNAAFDTVGTVTVAVTGVSGVRFGRAQVIVTAYDPVSDNTAAQAQATAAAVRDNAIAQLQEGATFGESSIVLKDSTGADQTITVTRAARNAIASTT
jgi:hypothetical protein